MAEVVEKQVQPLNNLQDFRNINSKVSKIINRTIGSLSITFRLLSPQINNLLNPVIFENYFGNCL